MKCEICGNVTNQLTVAKHTTLNCNLCTYYKTIDDKNNSKLLKEKYKGDFWSQEKLEEMIKTNFSNKQGQDYKLAQESMFEYCKKFIPISGNILEIGVGTGVHLLNFDKLGYRVTGIEPDPISTEFLNKTLKNGKCINGFIEDLVFDEKFDVIFLYHVVEHIEHPLSMIKKCKNLLNDNGVIIIAIPDCENPETLEQSISNPFHIWHFSKKSFEIINNKLKMNILSLESFARVPSSSRKLYRVLRKIHFSSFIKKKNPSFPLILTKNNDGYEIRLVLKNRF